MRSFLVRRWFLIALAATLAVGFLLAKPLEPVATQKWLRQLVLASVLFVMAWPLELAAIRSSLRSPLPVMLACGVNLGILPLVAWAMAVFLSPAEFANGLLVAAATPCTLASAAVWTRNAGGNDAVAMMVTVLTNGLCFLITPLWLFTTTSVEVSLSLSDMITKLALLVVLPMLLAQLTRMHHGIGRWATGHKSQLGIVAQIGVLSMVLFGAVIAGLRVQETDAAVASQLRAAAPASQLDGSLSGDSDSSIANPPNTNTDGPSNAGLLARLGIRPIQAGTMVVAVLALHLAALGIGVALGRTFGLARKDWIAVGFAGSQKTLMIGLSIAIDYGGLTLLPMIIYHAGQLLLDTLVVDYLRQKPKA